MKKEKLIIEMGEFTGETGREVYERFKREVDNKWNKLQQMQIPKSHGGGSREAVAEDIIVKALDKFLTPLSAKEKLERGTGQSITYNDLELIIQMDGEHTVQELRAMCKVKGLKHSGDKKLLAWRLLKYEHKI